MRRYFRSLDTRNSSRSLQSSGRNSTQSAGTRQLQKSEVVTPIKRSSSAPKTPASRLKTPTPLASRMKMKG
ncbi:hypothetical protein Y032_0706g1693 [Ancylostoma ceylanicum]|uniref:Uncharacterized protein n=1 Tax=Ancylostoma ceylanicum TaxID=53326 RepID=A0A016WI00_9BILA|nr:hypothetical protein Y032_0706g1693 [Ancylostoma ceylanicum]